MTRDTIIAIAASGLAAAAISGAAVDHVRTHDALATARHQAAAADQRARQAQARPPKTITKTVTKNVPVFGRSTLLGAYAAGSIAQGVYTDTGNLTFVASDTTCSQQYSVISQTSNGGTIDRDTFMKTCLNNIHDTAKTDPAP